MDLRASDAEREQTADALRHAAGEGRLTVEDLEERLAAAYGAATRSELAVLTRDVVEALPAPAAGRVPVRPGEDGADQLISVLSGTNRAGRWKLSPRVRVLNVLGSSNLDLNDAVFAADVVEMRIVSVLGGADVHVPEHLNVEVSEFSLLGGNEIEIGEAHPDPGGPTLRLHFVSILGGASLRRGRSQGHHRHRAPRPPVPPPGLHRP